ncbi:GAP family protein [Gordonia sp. i37]|uniref:GAP family protein n=1 Tax=Gordonia sp. i37 TaxID=1961707 RepID=UPI0009AEA930|nr:GAP family protein [Gordonia sp. i37]
MTHAVLDVLPIAVALLMASLPLVMMSMALVIKRTGVIGWCFLLGWLTGLAAVLVVLIAIVDVGSLSGGSGPAMGVVGVVAGLALLGWGIRKWQKVWTADGADSEVPGWYSMIEEIGAAKATASGFGLAALNPKNLLITVSAAAAIAEATADVGAQAVAIVVFVVVGSLAVAAPTIATSIAGERAEPTLARLDALITRHNALIVGTVLIVLGFVVITNGLEAL